MKAFRWLTIVLTSIFILFMTGCSPRPMHIDSPKRRAVIFVPGFKGSILGNGSEIVWVTAAKALTNGASLQLPLGGAPDPAALEPQGVLRRVSVLPGLYGYDVYGPFLDALARDLPDFSIIEFGYDWRLDNLAAVRRLATLIERLHSEGVQEIHLVAHSMGALITAYYLRYGSADFPDAREDWSGAARVRSVMLAGAPFLGSLDTLHDIEFGVPTFRNKTLLSSASLSTFPSMYQLLPAPETCAVTPCRDHDLFDVDFWARNSWGLCNQPGTGCDERSLDFLRQKLARGASFFRLLHSGASKIGPKRLPIVNVLSTDYATPAHIAWGNKPPAEEREFEANLSYAEGDGVVTSASAELPGAYHSMQVRRVTSHARHQFLYDDPAVRRAVVELVTGKAG